MVSLEHFSHPQNCIKSTNKIPPYAANYKKEYLFIRVLDNLSLVVNLKLYIEDTIMRLKNKSYEENWGKIIIYKMILNLLSFINEYFNNPTEDSLKIVDWYFIDLIIKKDKIIVRGFFMSLVYLLKINYLLKNF